MADVKSQLNSAALKYKKGNVTKEDMFYTTEKFGDQVQATVQLNFLEGMQFAGELAPNAKEAERNAAAQALAHLQDVAPSVGETSAPKKNNKKRKLPAGDAGKNGGYQQAMEMVEAMMGAGEQAGGWGLGTVHPSNGGDQSKMTLSQFVTKQTGKMATKDEIVYTTEAVEGAKPPKQQFVSTVVLVTIDADRSYQGEPQPNKKAAEVAAAAAALQENGVGSGEPVMKKAKQQGAGNKAQVQKPAAQQTIKPVKAAVPAKVVKATPAAPIRPVGKNVIKNGRA